MTEPDDGAGSDRSMLKTTARAEGPHFFITGRKWFITGASGASFGIVMARTDEHATMFLVDMKSDGISIERLIDTIDESMPGGHAVVQLNEVKVHQDQVLGRLGRTFAMHRCG
jgi:acyl-CoA dehydrogenase